MISGTASRSDLDNVVFLVLSQPNWLNTFKLDTVLNTWGVDVPDKNLRIYGTTGSQGVLASEPDRASLKHDEGYSSSQDPGFSILKAFCTQLDAFMALDHHPGHGSGPAPQR